MRDKAVWRFWWDTAEHIKAVHHSRSMGQRKKGVFPKWKRESFHMLHYNIAYKIHER